MNAQLVSGTFAAAVVLAAGTHASAQWWWPPDMAVDPACPPPQTIVTVTLSGQYPDTCIPNTADVVRVGTEIDLNTRREPPPGFCLTVIANWSLPVQVGALDAGTYSVYATHYRNGVPITPRALLGTFTVSPSCGGGGGACYANCDASTAAPVLNVADFTCFLTRFAGGDPWANCDASTTEPTLNVADFTCFLTKFAGGCP